MTDDRNRDDIESLIRESELVARAKRFRETYSHVAGTDLQLAGKFDELEEAIRTGNVHRVAPIMIELQTLVKRHKDSSN